MIDTLVIGGGHNALVAAAYLARAGRRPLLLERRTEVGGGAVTGEIAPGFRVPTYTHEVLLHDDIVKTLDLGRHGLEPLVPQVAACAIDPAGAPPLALFDDPLATANALLALGGTTAQRYAQFRAAVDAMTAVLGPLLAHEVPRAGVPALGDLWHLLVTARAVRALGARESRRLLRWLTMPIADVLDDALDSEPLKALVAGPALSGSSRGPRAGGTMLAFLLRESHRRLARTANLRARGGPGAVTRALASAARAAGVEIRLGTAVERIMVNNGHVTGVVAGGEELAADLVVSGLDPRSTLRGLVDPSVLPADVVERIGHYRARGALAKVNLALSELPRFRGVGPDPGLLSGRVQLGHTLEVLERASDRAKYGELPRDPWLELELPSVLDPALAPRGAHVASVYVHYAPRELVDDRWVYSTSVLQRSVLDVLDRHAPGIVRTVVAADVVTPERLEQELGLSGGHVFHGELVPDQLFAARPTLGWGRYATPIQGLFLCGAGTHPGGFMTGASGRLAARAALRAPKR